MPYGLMDMFQPQDTLGQPTDFGNAMTGRANAMIGMGAALMSPRPVGTSAFANAGQAWQQGMAADLAAARTQQQMQMERQRLQLAREQMNKDPEQVRLWKLSEGNPEMR